MNLRTKILSGFLILIVMLFMAGVWSIYELTFMGSSVQRLLDDNYKSINAAKIMIEALEREDSAVLLVISGKREQGRSIADSADKLFQRGFKIARENVTVDGEQACINAIESKYDAYKNLWKKPADSTRNGGNLNWYFQEVHQTFLDVKLFVNKLMELNDQTMYQTASDLKSRAHRAIMPGIVAILSAFVFAVIFTYFVNFYVVTPMVKIEKGVQEFIESGKPFDVKIETNDELYQLTCAIQDLCARSRASEAIK